jgi:hypothetical protein
MLFFYLFNKTPAQAFTVTLASIGKLHNMWFGLNSQKTLFTATQTFCMFSTGITMNNLTPYLENQQKND